MEIKQTEQRTGKRILLAIDVQKGFERKECTLKNAEKLVSCFGKNCSMR